MISSNRLLPCLKINSKKELICTENFEKHFYVGDPLNAICIFNDFKVDELIVIDIDASKQNRLFDREYLLKISEEFQYPLVVGGGVSSIKDIEILLNSGADRVLISNSCIFNSKFIEEAIKHFGSSTITICLDYVQTTNKNCLLYDHTKKKFLNSSLLEKFKELSNIGMGECILQSVDRDGKMSGYDSKNLDYFNREFNNPIVCLGGCSGYDEILSLENEFKLKSFSVGSSFCFFNKQRQVLINYFKKNEV